MQVSVGRLGIMTQLTLKIVPQQAVRRVEQDMTASQFADQVKQVQDAYTQAKQTGSASAIWAALHSLNETQVLVLVILSHAPMDSDFQIPAALTDNYIMLKAILDLASIVSWSWKLVCMLSLHTNTASN